MVTKEDINKLATTLSEMTKTLNSATVLANDVVEKLRKLQEEIPVLSYEKGKLLDEIEELQEDKAQLIDSLQKTIDGLKHATGDEAGLNTYKRQETAANPTKKELPNTVKNPIKKPSDTTAAIADQFKAQTSINDTIAKPEPTLTMRQPIRDIAKAIAINDRFLFIRELFEGDATLFAQTIDKLNTMSNIEEAKKHMQTVVKNWDTTTEPTQLFLSIVQRRYL
jgi:TolA-binding protein